MAVIPSESRDNSNEGDVGGPAMPWDGSDTLHVVSLNLLNAGYRLFSGGSGAPDQVLSVVSRLSKLMANPDLWIRIRLTDDA